MNMHKIKINVFLLEMLCVVVLVAENGEFKRCKGFASQVNVRRKAFKSLNSPFSSTRTTTHNISGKNTFILILHVNIHRSMLR